MLDTRHRLAKPVTAFLTAALVAPAAYGDMLIGSWNLKHLGWGEKRFDKVAHVAQHIDLLALQELMNPDALERLEQEVETATGESWSSMASHALGRSSYREHYAFLWRDSAVAYDSGAVVYIDDRDVFAREPFSAVFRSQRTGTRFALGNVHITYGSSIGDRLPEIQALASYWEWMGEIYPDTPRLLAGDFNLRPTHAGWEPLRALGVAPLLTEGATTLGVSDGSWANLYDNIWHIPERVNITGRGIVRFPDLFEVSHTEVRKSVSDHAPVWLALGETNMTLTSFAGGAYHEQAPTTRECLDLNSASPSALEVLPNVGAARAKQIVELRPWVGVETLDRVHGLGAASVEAIRASGLVCD